ncbi:serine hydrolase domain-containing protein [Novosphingobium rosa]|uniref:serine hydrolase domain-containing protein n=1 Tax=Novosphingobium rosa TaxID=76978 RepID=UPI000ACF0F6C|nr:serine hydrolase [Novosphingobium rosa]
MSLIAPLALLPALMACHSQGQPPLPPEALAAVNDHPGAPREPLARAVDALFTERDLGETRALLVMYKGRIVAERYAPGYGPDTRLIGWSMSKSVTGVLVGLLVADGRLRLDEAIPVPAWQRPGDPRGEITLRQLLQMRSGLRHRESGDPVRDTDTVRMLFTDGRDDMAAYAEAQPLEHEPGSTWVYSTATAIILSDIATRALTDSRDPRIRRETMADYLHTRLFEPLGMRSAVAEYDAAGTLEGGSMIHATARDWAKFGEFLRLGGTVQGARIVPSDWVSFMTTPSPRNPGYGAQIWLNRPQVDGHSELLPGRAPKSMFAAIGHLGQYILVLPDQQLTVVRLGKSSTQERVPLMSRLGDIVALYVGSEG